MDLSTLIAHISSYFENSSVGVLCGAGVSISSGIPDAYNIVYKLLEKLDCEPEDIRKFLSLRETQQGYLPIAFEAIIGTIENSIEFMDPQNDFLTLFAQNFEAKPTQNHYFFADLFREKKLQFIATTNFDTCLEQALGIPSISENVVVSYPNESSSLQEIDIYGKIIKLHGTMNSPADLGTTIDQINNRQNVENINILTEKIFKKAKHSTILVIGYSCSDTMDIIPKLQNIGHYQPDNEKVQIIHWLYQRNGTTYKWNLLEDIAEDTPELMKIKDAYRGFKNTIVISGDWGLFIETYAGVPKNSYKKDFAIRPQIANPMFVLGALFSKAGMFPLGIKYYTKEIEILKKSNCPSDDIKQAICYRYLGDAYGLNDNITASLNALENSILIIEKSKNVNKLELAESYYSLSETYEDMGELKKAIEKAHYAEKLYIAEYNNEYHPELAKIYSTLGEFYNKDGYPRIGLEYCKKSLKIRLRLFNERHPDIANTYTNMGCCLSSMGPIFYKRAKQCHLKSLEIRKNVYGINHERVAQSYNNLGHIYYRLKEYSLALECYQKVFQIFNKIGNGADSYLAGAVYENIGSVFCDRNKGRDLEESLRYFFAAHKVYLKIFEDELHNYNFARLFCSIAIVCIQLGRRREAQQCLTAVLQIADNLGLPRKDAVLRRANKALKVLNSNKSMKKSC